METSKVAKTQQLLEVFTDTEDFYQTDKYLQWFVQYEKENTELYLGYEYPVIPLIIKDLIDYVETNLPFILAPSLYGDLDTDGRFSKELDELEHGRPYMKPKNGEIRIDSLKTFEAAEKLRKEFPGNRIAVLNFASAVSPGGGVRNGARAQEESLCRCSTLLPSLEQTWLDKEYYARNRNEHNRLNTDACIYTPDVIICKTDENIPKRLGADQWNNVDVISCAAPDLRYSNPGKYDSDFLYRLFLKRIDHILHIAAAKNADVMILGAFGCGAFKNDPKLVAKAFREALQRYRYYFDLVEFAIPGGFDKENLQTFRDVLLTPDSEE